MNGGDKNGSVAIRFSAAQNLRGSRAWKGQFLATLMCIFAENLCTVYMSVKQKKVKKIIIFRP